MSLTTPNTKFQNDCRLAGWSPASLLAALSPPPTTDKRGNIKGPNIPVEEEDTKLFTLKIYDSAEKPNVVTEELAPLRDLAGDTGECSTDIMQLSSLFEQQTLSAPHKSAIPACVEKENKTDPPQHSSFTRLRKPDSDVLQNLTPTNTPALAPINAMEYVRPIVDAPLSNGWKLFKHQKEAIWKCLEMNRIILAYDMGLGKTLIGLKYAQAMCALHKPCALVVIAPCTLIENWKREGEIVGFSSVNLKDLVTPAKSAKSCRQIDSSNLSLITVSWAKIPVVSDILKCFSNFVVVADEAHAMQTMTSIRTKSALTLCQHRACRGVILATGTPMKNGRPVNLYPLLVAIRHPISFHKLEYEKRYCNAKKTPFCAWDTSGVSNLAELKAKVGQSLLRKTKEECLADLPVLERTQVVLPLSAEDSQAYQVIIDEHLGDSTDTINGKGKAASRAMKTKKNLYQAGELLGKLRQFCSLSKVNGTAEIIRKHFTSDEPGPVVVFVWFRESAFKLIEELSEASSSSSPDGDDIIDLTEDDDCLPPRQLALTCASMTGDIVQQSARQQIVDRFQSGSIDVLVCTYGVGATGITLTKSHTVILLDRPWTPGDVLQAEDRVRRIGQTSSTVTSSWISKYPVDEKLDKLLQTKDSNCQIVLNAASRNWFNKDGNSSKTRQEQQTIKAFCHSSSSSMGSSSGISNKPPCVSQNSNKSTERWNVRECEEETTAISSSVMSELMKELL